MESNNETDDFNLDEQKLVIKDLISLMENNDLSQLCLEKIESIGGGIIHNAFSKEECEFLIENIKYNEDLLYKRQENEKVYRKHLRLLIDD